jgi:hypothetical protein
MPLNRSLVFFHQGSSGDPPGREGELVKKRTCRFAGLCGNRLVRDLHDWLPTTQKVASGAALGGGTGLLLGGPIGAGVGAAIGAVAVPVATQD